MYAYSIPASTLPNVYHVSYIQLIHVFDLYYYSLFTQDCCTVDVQFYPKEIFMLHLHKYKLTLNYAYIIYRTCLQCDYIVHSACGKNIKCTCESTCDVRMCTGACKNNIE